MSSRHHPDEEVNRWLTVVEAKIPFNNKEDMDAFETAMGNPTWMIHARDHFAKYGGTTKSMKAIFHVLFGDWVKENVCFHRPMVSIMI